MTDQMSSAATQYWTPYDWVNRGSEQIAADPELAKRMIGQGLKQAAHFFFAAQVEAVIRQLHAVFLRN